MNNTDNQTYTKKEITDSQPLTQLRYTPLSPIVQPQLTIYRAIDNFHKRRSELFTYGCNFCDYETKLKNMIFDHIKVGCENHPIEPDTDYKTHYLDNPCGVALHHAKEPQFVKKQINVTCGQCKIKINSTEENK